MNVKEFYKSQNYPDFDKHDKKVSKFDYSDMIDFADEYAAHVVNENNVIPSVMPRIKETITELLNDAERVEKELEKIGVDMMPLAVAKSQAYAYAIALQVIKRYEA